MGQSPTNIQRALSMSEKQRLRNAAGDCCLFCHSKRTLYVQVPMTLSEKKLSKSQFVILNARFSTLNVHLLLQTCVYFVNSPFFRNFEFKNFVKFFPSMVCQKKSSIDKTTRKSANISNSRDCIGKKYPENVHSAMGLLLKLR